MAREPLSPPEHLSQPLLVQTRHLYGLQPVRPRTVGTKELKIKSTIFQPTAATNRSFDSLYSL